MDKDDPRYPAALAQRKRMDLVQAVWAAMDDLDVHWDLAGLEPGDEIDTDRLTGDPRDVALYRALQAASEALYTHEHGPRRYRLRPPVLAENGKSACMSLSFVEAGHEPRPGAAIGEVN